MRKAFPFKLQQDNKKEELHSKCNRLSTPNHDEAILLFAVVEDIGRRTFEKARSGGSAKDISTTKDIIIL